MLSCGIVTSVVFSDDVGASVVVKSSGVVVVVNALGVTTSVAFVTSVVVISDDSGNSVVVISCGVFFNSLGDVVNSLGVVGPVVIVSSVVLISDVVGASVVDLRGDVGGLSVVLSDEVGISVIAATCGVVSSVVFVTSADVVGILVVILTFVAAKPASI